MHHRQCDRVLHHKLADSRAVEAQRTLEQSVLRRDGDKRRATEEEAEGDFAGEFDECAGGVGLFGCAEAFRLVIILKVPVRKELLEFSYVTGRLESPGVGLPVEIVGTFAFVEMVLGSGVVLELSVP